MAPLCADPRQVVIALNPARRAALLRLIEEITAYMTFELVTPPEEMGAIVPEDSFNDDRSESASPAPSEPTSAPGTGTATPVEDEKKNPNPNPKKPLVKKATKATKKVENTQEAALVYMQEWKNEFLPKLREIIHVEDTAKIKQERTNRLEAMEKKKLDTPEEGEHLISFGNVHIDKSEDVASLQKLYHPIPSRLTTIPAHDRREALSCVLLLLLSTGKYSAHSRTMVLYLASALEIPQTFVNREEAEIAQELMESSTKNKNEKESMSAEAEAEKRRQQNKFSRFWKVGLASVAGATIIGVTGGLAAPLVAGAIGGIMGGVGLGGVASFLGIFWMNGALVGALFGAYGAKMTGELMDKYAKEVEDFKFIPLAEEWGSDFKTPDKADQDNMFFNQDEEREKQQKKEESRRLRVTIGINGWLNSEEDVTIPWRVLDADTEVFALRYEVKTLLSLGTALKDLVQSFAWKALKVEIIKRTVLATLWAALWPIQVMSAASNVDNPFNRASNRSKKAGRLLADALINRVQGERPVTLVGYSLGATAIHACLQSLAERQAFGLIENVVIIGTPAPSNAAHWRTLRCVVSGKIFNVYSENDMMLGWVYRMHSLALGVAGLQAIEGVEGVENVNLSDKVSGHLRYPSLIGEILRSCGFLGVRASNGIEKDDVIMMKDEHAEGKLVDLDAAAAEANGNENGSKGALKDKSYGKDTGRSNSTSSKVADDLRGLNISPPALSPPAAEKNSQLPARPADNAQAHLMPARKPVAQMKMPRESEEDDFDNEPALVQDRAKRADTPESNAGDDMEFMSITMEDKDAH